MSYTKVTYALDERVAVIRLNDPATLNSFTNALGEELLHALRRATGEARAILLCAEGRAFCAGANLTDGRIDLDDDDRDMGGRLDGLVNPIIYQMRAAEIPIVTAVRGAAAGVGCGIALAGDLIVASDTAFFLQAFRNIGLAPDGGSSYLLSRAVGRPRAMEMMLLGERIPAATALDWGMINRVWPDAEFDDAALAFAQSLAKGPRSLGIIKRVAWAAVDAAFETALSNERVAQREAGRTADFVEGVRAFREKRKAAFTGQ